MTANQTASPKTNQQDQSHASETRIAAAVEAAYILQAVGR
jgi:hypothetical protein